MTKNKEKDFVKAANISKFLTGKKRVPTGKWFDQIIADINETVFQIANNIKLTREQARQASKMGLKDGTE